MKKFEITKSYLIDRGHGWEGRAESHTIEEFKAPNQKEAISYFRKNYGPLKDIWSNNFYIKNDKTIDTYELQTVVDFDDEETDINIIAYAIAND